ncbi:MAG: PAS domain S-box protein [Methanoregula sp.]|jgi:PAS domain S-box-containing protein
MPPAGKPPDVSSRGLIAAIILVLLVITAAGTLLYQSQEVQITQQVTGDLTSIGILKAGQIATWREDRLVDARVISSSAFFTDGAAHYLTYGDDESREKIINRFREINESYHYDNVLLLDPRGEVRLSLDPAITSIQPSLKAKVNESLESGTAAFVDFYRLPASRGIRLGVIAPLIMKTDDHGKPAGAVLLSVNPDEFLYPLLQSWPVSRESAETLLIEREEDHVLFLNDLRYENNTALNLTIPLTRTDVPAVMAVLGTTGAFTGRDYRNVDVISVLEPVPGSPWYMISKVDSAEAYSAWRSNAALIIVLTVVSLFGAIIIIGLVWQRRQKYYYKSLYATESERGREAVQNRERMETLLHLAEMESASEQDLSEFVLDAGCRLTDSSLAFIGMMSPDESVFDITAWSKSAMKDCSVAASPIHYPIDKAGIWAEAVRQRKPIIANDYPAPQPGKKGLPSGHVPVTRFVSVPIFEKQRIVMVCAVANKKTDYTSLDVDNLTLLMQGVWNHFRKRMADEALHRKTADLESAHEELTATDEELAANYEELARNQGALAESERRYRNLYQYAQVGLFETSFRDGTVVACNREYAELAGYSSVESAIGQDIFHLYANPEDRTEVGRILREQGYIENYTVKFRNQTTGKVFWGQFSARFNYEQDVAEGTIIDVTSQKEAEEALRENERRLRESQAMAHLGFWYWDVKTGNVEWSDEVFRIFGLDPKTFTPRIDSILALSPWPEDHERDQELIMRATESHEAGSYEQRFLRPDKSTGYYHSTFEGRYDEGGNLVLIVGTVLDITERKQAEEILRESETRLSLALGVGNAGVWQWNLETNEVSFDTPFHELLGYNPGELPTNLQEWMSYHNQEDVPVWMEKAEAYLRGDTPMYESEHRIRTKTGEWAWVFTRGQLVNLPATGSKRLFVGIAMNVTERRKAEAALRESEDAFRSLAENASDGFLVGGPDGKHVFANKRAAEITGYSIEELVHTSIRQLARPDEFERVIQDRFKKRMAGEPAPDQYETALTGKDGRNIPIELSSSKVQWYGQPADLIVFRDITERKAAEDALRQSEEKYRVLFTRMTEGSALHEMVYDKTGNPADYRILDANPAFERVLGIKGADVTGKTSREAYGVATPPFLDIYARVAATGRPELFETYFEPLKKHFSISAFSPEKGKFATIFEDITDRKQAEELRERLIKELEQKNAELEQFTYTVSHDLKSPLITIKGFAGLLEDDAGKQDPVQLKKDVRRIIAAADTMQVLLSDLLELSQVGKIIKPPEKILFGKIAYEAVDLLAGPLAERGVNVEIAPDLPLVNVDHARIREVMTNLIENAIKFLGDQKNPVIRIGMDRSGESPVFFVQDNGIGINPRYLERIFNLFEKLDTSAHGTGIGLSIVRRIVEVHGGKIWAESEGMGKGTTFRFTLPGDLPAHDPEPKAAG